MYIVQFSYPFATYGMTFLMFYNTVLIYSILDLTDLSVVLLYTISVVRAGMQCWCRTVTVYLEAESWHGSLDEEAMSKFGSWLQCYCKPEMKNLVDNLGRTIWFQVCLLFDVKSCNLKINHTVTMHLLACSVNRQGCPTCTFIINWNFFY